MTQRLVLKNLNPDYVVQGSDTPPTVIEFGSVLRGSDGRDGTNGRDATTYAFPYPDPTALWTIVHGLGRYPSVTVVDADGEEVGALPEYVDANTVHIEFAIAFAGVAYLN